MFHISDIKKFNRCPRLFYNDLSLSYTSYQPFVRLDETVSDLVIRKFGITDYFLGERNDPKERALQALNQYDWFIKARFEYQNLRIKVPFLHRIEEGWELYFLFVGLYPKADDLQFYTDTVWVLNGNGIYPTSIKMIHLNADYVRGEELDVDALFCVSEHFYNDRNNPSVNIQEAIQSRMVDLTHVLNQMEACKEENLPPIKRMPRCAGRVKCRYYDACFHEDTLPDNSIINLVGARYRYDMQAEGIAFMKDADIERIEGSRIQYAQIMADQNGGLFIDQLAVKTWMRDITYPITFLDFEWERYAIPPYNGMKPFDVLPFEYSIHVLQEDGQMTHQVFLSIHDDRKELIESLLKDIPATGTIMAFNAVGAEMIRIREFANQFPEYEAQLIALNKRMKDLQYPFETGLVYDTRMKGSWSLKSIMGMLDDQGYRNLDIAQGMDAVYQWRYLDRMDESVSQQDIMEELKAYCGMDTYAMTVVYKWLKELTKSML